MLLLIKSTLARPAMWWKSKSLSVNFLLLFFSWSFLSIFWAQNYSLAWHQFLLLTQALLIGAIVLFFLKTQIFSFDQLLWLIVFATVFESLVGFFQVVFQGSVGLYFLGESYLDVLNPQVAKTLVWGGGRLLRAYGTFVHPNVLGAFLVVGILSLVNIIFFQRPFKNDFIRYFSLIMMFTLLLGLILTFSRSAWLTGILVLFFWLAYLFWKEKDLRPKIFLISLTLLIIVIALLLSLWLFVLPKLSFSLAEPSVGLRLDYLKTGWEILKQNLFIGIGLGNQILYAGQPIHNLYLLIASETGLIGLGLFLSLIFSVLSIVNGQWSKVTLISFLILALFDHYFWTIPTGLLIFWTIIILNINLSKPEFDF